MVQQNQEKEKTEGTAWADAMSIAVEKTRASLDQNRIKLEKKNNELMNVIQSKDEVIADLQLKLSSKDALLDMQAQ